MVALEQDQEGSKIGWENEIMMQKDRVVFKIFDKTFPENNGMYSLTRFEGTDKLQLVQNNRRAIIDYFKANHILIMKHVHGVEVIDADLIQDFSTEPQGDAAVTSRKNIILSVQSADCVPVLLGSNNGKVIAAAHCGWRSAKADILVKLIDQMKAKEADNIFAIIGPAIHQEHYEVGEEFYEDILALEPKSLVLFKKSRNPQKWLFDLPAFVKFKLEKLGISNITDLCEDTYSNPNKYYSYRYDIHLNLLHNPTNILSTIMLKKI